MDLSLLPLVFSLILTVASRLLHPYSTDDKTSRLMGKRLSTVRNTQKGLLSYMENLLSINLDVLSSVLYGWRSLEATVRISLKTRDRRLKSQI